jgi:hypothetical protein
VLQLFHDPELAEETIARYYGVLKRTDEGGLKFLLVLLVWDVHLTTFNNSFDIKAT